jgi:hypothetical protein
LRAGRHERTGGGQGFIHRILRRFLFLDLKYGVVSLIGVLIIIRTPGMTTLFK